MPDVMDTLAVLQSPAWMADGECGRPGRDPEDWFPTHTRDFNEVRTARAVRVCRDCPVIRDCLQYALDNHERYAVMGGQTPRQRFAILRRLGWQGELKT